MFLFQWACSEQFSFFSSEFVVSDSVIQSPGFKNGSCFPYGGMPYHATLVWCQLQRAEIRMLQTNPHCQYSHLDCGCYYFTLSLSPHSLSCPQPPCTPSPLYPYAYSAHMGKQVHKSWASKQINLYSFKKMCGTVDEIYWLSVLTVKVIFCSSAINSGKSSLW